MNAVKRFSFARRIVSALNQVSEGEWILLPDNVKGCSDFISIKTIYKHGADKNLEFTLMVGHIHHTPDGCDSADLLFEYDYGVDACMVVVENDFSVARIADDITYFLEYYAA